MLQPQTPTNRQSGTQGCRTCRSLRILGRLGLVCDRFGIYLWRGCATTFSSIQTAASATRIRADNDFAPTFRMMAAR
jgi:hypothetical protein